jgi:hypothetical protein
VRHGVSIGSEITYWLGVAGQYARTLFWGEYAGAILREAPMKAQSWRFAILFAAPAVLALAGCEETWTKPGATPPEFDAAKAACTSRATEKFPPLPQRVALPAETPSTTSCYGSGSMVSCYSTIGQAAPTFVTIDRNDPERSDAIRACLVENGWQPGARK